MAKRYDPVLCMMVDESAKAQDAKSYGKYKLPNGEIVEVIDRKNVHGVDTIVYKNSRGVHFATVDWFMSNAKKVQDSAKAKDESEKYAVIMKNSSGKEQYTQGWDLGSIRNWIKDNEKRGYRVTWKNFDSKTIDKAKDSNTIDKAIRICDASTGHKVVVFVENYLRSIGKNNSTGKYDKIVQGVRSLLSESLLDDEDLKKAAEHEADRLLKKYNL